MKIAFLATRLVTKQLFNYSISDGMIFTVGGRKVSGGIDPKEDRVHRTSVGFQKSRFTYLYISAMIFI